MSAIDHLPRALGRPRARARLRACAEDFQVTEVLGFEPAGEGQHRLLWVEKAGLTSDQVARALARLAGVRPMAVGYAGLKDRHALARQWFSVDLAGRPEPDWTRLPLPGARVLAAHPHRRKLACGTLQGNRFRITLRALRGDRDELSDRLAAIARVGVPNYFGEQRFGRGGGNLARARAWFAGGRRPRGRGERSLLLSSARSALFNAVLAARVADGTWNRLLPGDAPMLDGRRAVFRSPLPGAEDQARCRRLEIHPTGPLWGRGASLVSGSVAALEARLCRRRADLAEGLERAGLEAARRALRVRVSELEWAWEGPDLRLAFHLPAGAYATVVLRELVQAEVGLSGPASAAI